VLCAPCHSYAVLYFIFEIFYVHIIFSYKLYKQHIDYSKIYPSLISIVLSLEKIY